MTQKEFNTKFKAWIPDGWGGLEFDIPKVTEYLDLVMQDMILIPGFELNQIKLKFNQARFYFETTWKSKELEAALQLKVQERINDLVKGYDRWDKMAKLRVEANSPHNDGWTKEHYEKEYKLNSRMDVIGQNGNEGTHYEEEDWMDKEYKSGYEKTLKSGMFWEWYPRLTGVWEQDKYEFCHELKRIEAKMKSDD